MRANTRSFTLLEAVVSSAILALIVGVALGSLAKTQEGVGDSLGIGDTAQRANSLVLDLTRELRGAGVFVLGGAALSPGGNFTNVTYQRVVGFNFSSTSPSFSNRKRMIRFVYDAGEVGAGSGDNVDNDRDGLVDEGRLELLEDTNLDGTVAGNEVLAVLARNVLGGNAIRFRFVPSGTATPDLTQDTELLIDCTLAQRLPKDGRIHREPRTIRIALRNTP